MQRAMLTTAVVGPAVYRVSWSGGVAAGPAAALAAVGGAAAGAAGRATVFPAAFLLTLHP